MLITRRPLAWPKICYATVPLAVVIALTTGGDAQGPWLFLSSTLPLVKAKGEPYAKERALLRTAIETARADLPNYAFRQAIYKKMLSNTRPDAELGPDYTALAKDKARFSKVANTLGRAALLDHPVQYFRLVVMKVIASAANRHPEERLFPARFWEDQNHASEGRWARRPAGCAWSMKWRNPLISRWSRSGRSASFGSARCSIRCDNRSTGCEPVRDVRVSRQSSTFRPSAG